MLSGKQITESSFFSTLKTRVPFCLWCYPGNALGWFLLIQRLPKVGIPTFLLPWCFYPLCSPLTLTALPLITSTKLIYHWCVHFLRGWGGGRMHYSMGSPLCQVQIIRSWMFTFAGWSLDLASESSGEMSLDSL